MSRVPYPYENDAELLQGLSNRICLERVEDLASYVGYVLHDSAWWRVLGSDPAEGVELEIAGPSDPLHPQASVLRAPPRDLVIYADEGTGLQFLEGVLLDTPWPVGDLIYVAEARCRGVGDDPDESVYGIFSLRLDEDGDSYYAPVDREYQPGVASWILRPERDLVLDWSPVDVADLLTRMEARHG